MTQESKTKDLGYISKTQALNFIDLEIKSDRSFQIAFLDKKTEKIHYVTHSVDTCETKIDDTGSKWLKIS